MIEIVCIDPFQCKAWPIWLSARSCLHATWQGLDWIFENFQCWSSLQNGRKARHGGFPIHVCPMNFRGTTLSKQHHLNPRWHGMFVLLSYLLLPENRSVLHARFELLWERRVVPWDLRGSKTAIFVEKAKKTPGSGMGPWWTCTSIFDSFYCEPLGGLAVWHSKGRVYA